MDETASCRVERAWGDEYDIDQKSTVRGLTYQERKRKVVEQGSYRINQSCACVLRITTVRGQRQSVAAC